MDSISQTLNALGAEERQHPVIPDLQTLWGSTPERATGEERIKLHREAIRLIDEAQSSNRVEPRLLPLYQQLYREMEALIAATGEDDRHSFVVIIPVADRPQHLKGCLESLLQLCRLYHYGGFDGTRYPKISVIIADDSRESDNISSHREMAAAFSVEGLTTRHYGQAEQLQQIASLSEDDQGRLKAVIGKADPHAFHHKGASLMRNITYLSLADSDLKKDKTLFYFIDSDQEFNVKVESDEGDRNLYAINYFDALDTIFQKTDASILTGKVVGDPPVSPAVMAGNFLEDVIQFLDSMEKASASAPCSFHPQQREKADDAAYHDMADLFGFKTAATPFHYRCTLTGSHDHQRCFNHFAEKLNRFFDGEHPTRKSYYTPDNLLSGIQAARTIYTGNYIFRPEMLTYFIPFAPLKLRMAGPVLGRIIQAEIRDQFVSANLPMLHKRTVSDQGVSEFRPGIDRNANQVDLSGEFERQYFGDVMLFSMVKLTAAGYPTTGLPPQQIKETVSAIEAELFTKYGLKQQQIMERLEHLKSAFNNRERWWNEAEILADGRGAFASFIDNIERNFHADGIGYQLIAPGHHKDRRLADICAAITDYPDDRKAWDRALNPEQSP